MVDPNDETLAPVWTSIRILLLSIGGVMLGDGLTTSSAAYRWTMIAAGAVGIVGPAAWGVYASITNAARAKAAQAKAVQAGLNLAASGQMLGTDGKPLAIHDPQGLGTPPLPVTITSAQQIIKDFAPAESARPA